MQLMTEYIYYNIHWWSDMLIKADHPSITLIHLDLHFVLTYTVILTVLWWAVAEGETQMASIHIFNRNGNLL